ncbi:arylformamidase [Rubrobacter indicoceani]|uniref:arylformamidase n=1 Tax=Rubrobacter indicoceani TaxID=2051957 RepID=UPI000E5AA1A5|nr:arylformamidase [Rubrobacter indicoceani]
MNDIIDITQPLRNGIPPWPGDTPFHFEPTGRLGENGSVVNVGKFVVSCHTGTHIDAPFHYDDRGRRVHELDLELYVGAARVVDLSNVPGLKTVNRAALEAFELSGVERVLIKTNCWTERDVFPEEIVHLTPDGAKYLQTIGVRLVGVDVPSVDGIHSKGLPTHQALNRASIHILEGVVLDEVDAGDYELICLPLPLQSADGSPVRAVLRRVD